MKYPFYRAMTPALLLSIFLISPHQAQAGACDLYKETTMRISDQFRTNALLQELEIDLKINLSSKKTGENLASMIKDFGGRFSRDKVTLNISEKYCDLKLSQDALAVVVCHEIGHLLGGAPYDNSAFKFDLDRLKADKEYKLRFWSSEGEADYWATLKCLPIVWENENNIGWLARQKLDERYRTSIRDCNAYHGEGTNRAALCLRSVVASVESARALQQTLFDKLLREDEERFKNGGTRVLSKKQREEGAALPNPDEYDSIVAKMTNYNKHPRAQCRLDTYIAGALCPTPLNQPMDFEKVKDGACLSTGKYPKGARPACWFNEEKALRRKN